MSESVDTFSVLQPESEASPYVVLKDGKFFASFCRQQSTDNEKAPDDGLANAEASSRSVSPGSPRPSEVNHTTSLVAELRELIRGPHYVSADTIHQLRLGIQQAIAVLTQQARRPASFEDALAEYDRAIARGADHASAVQFMLAAIRRVTQ